MAPQLLCCSRPFFLSDVLIKTVTVSHTVPKSPLTSRILSSLQRAPNGSINNTGSVEQIEIHSPDRTFPQHCRNPSFFSAPVCPELPEGDSPVQLLLSPWRIRFVVGSAHQKFNRQICLVEHILVRGIFVKLEHANHRIYYSTIHEGYTFRTICNAFFVLIFPKCKVPPQVTPSYHLFIITLQWTKKNSVMLLYVHWELHLRLI